MSKFIKIAQAQEAVNSITSIFTLTNLLGGDVVGAVANLTAQYLFNLNMIDQDFGNAIGLPPPKDVSTAQQIKSAKDAFYNLLLVQDQNEFLKLSQTFETIDANISLKENYLISLAESEVNTDLTNRGSVPGFIQNPQKVQEEYKKFIDYLDETIDLCSFFHDWVASRVAQMKAGQYNPELQKETGLFTVLGTVENYASTIIEKRQKTANLKGKYYSLNVIIREVYEKKLLLQRLNSLVPNLKVYLNNGMSVVDLLRMPGGLMGTLREIYDKQNGMVNSLFAELTKWRNYKKVPEFKLPFSTLKNKIPPKNTSGTNIPSDLSSSGNDVQAPDGSYFDPNQKEAIAMDENRNPIFAFTNQIFEKRAATSPVIDPAQTPFDFYNSKINISGTKLDVLENQIREDGRLTDDEKIKLFTSINAKKNTPIIQPKGQPTLELINYQSLLDSYNKFSKELGGALEVKPLLGSTELTPEQVLKSLESQYVDSVGKLGELKSIYLELLNNPNSLGSLTSLASPTFKFVKLAEDKTVESDKRWVEYWDNYMGEEPVDPVDWGTIVYEKPKHNTKTINEEQELHNTKKSKFTKVDSEV
jgi:hypothetical protein